MNSYFMTTADSDIIQSPITFEPTKKALNGSSPVIKRFPLISLVEQGFLMPFIDFNNRLCSVLALNKTSQFIAAIASVTNNILRMKFAIGKPCLTEDTTSNTNIIDRASSNISLFCDQKVGRTYADLVYEPKNSSDV